MIVTIRRQRRQTMIGTEFNRGRNGLMLAGGLALFLAGCLSPAHYRKQADQVAEKIITGEQQKALGRTEPFTIERPSDTLRRMLLEDQRLPVSSPASYGADRLAPIPQRPEADYPKPVSSPGPFHDIPRAKPLALSLVNALEVAARNSLNYQGEKEKVFQAALDLSLQIHQFENTYQGLVQSVFTANQSDSAFSQLESLTSVESDARRRLQSGATLTGRIILDLAEMLSSGQASSAGLAADASISIPLLRGAGRFVTTEPLRQSERNVIYALWGFDQFRRGFVVGIVGQYFSVLQAQDQVKNAENNYINQVLARRRQEALEQEGRVGQEQLDQARQAELSARNAWISSQRRYESALDSFKVTLGLPTDARIETDRKELERLSETANRRLGVKASSTNSLALGPNGQAVVPNAQAPVHLQPPSKKGAGPYEIPEAKAVHVALEHRLDLRTAQQQVDDAQRRVAVAADALRAGLTLTGSGTVSDRRALDGSSAGAALFSPQASYRAGLALDLPFERTSERNAYRNSYILLEQAVRGFQSLEDQVKLQIRSDLRDLAEQRESYQIQLLALQVAGRRVDRTRAFLEVGRPGVSTRDVNEAQAAYLQAQNSVTSALISYRLSELSLQRDMGVLRVSAQGLYTEIEANELD